MEAKRGYNITRWLGRMNWQGNIRNIFKNKSFNRKVLLNMRAVHVSSIICMSLRHATCRTLSICFWQSFLTMVTRNNMNNSHFEKPYLLYFNNRILIVTDLSNFFIHIFSKWKHLQQLVYKLLTSRLSIIILPVLIGKSQMAVTFFTLMNGSGWCYYQYVSVNIV